MPWIPLSPPVKAVPSAVHDNYSLRGPYSF
jgi:hypothetical protein